jgi:hypothetical protein
MPHAESPPDLSFVDARYGKHEARLLVQMNKSHRKGMWNAITPYHLVPFWFGNERAPKGFARIKAPVLPPKRQARMMALHHHARSGEDRSHQVAALYVNVLLWATMFPKECARNYEVDEVFDFEPADVVEWLAANTGRESQAYAAGFDLAAADCVRIAYNQL